MGKSTEIQSLEIMRKCPRFLSCSVAICPLDLLQAERTRLRGEPKCSLAKSIRQRTARGTVLPRQGLSNHEWAARMRWETLSVSEKERRKAHLKAGSSTYTGFSGGTAADLHVDVLSVGERGLQE